MKILLFTDLHIHNFKRFGSHESGMSKRLYEQTQVIDKIVNICTKYKPELVISGGDLLHKAGEIPTECINIAKSFVDRFKDILLVDGNHDLVCLENSKWFHSINRMFGDRIITTNRDNASIHLIHYDDKIDYEKVKGFDLVVVHKTPQGCRVGNYVFEDGFDWKTLSANNKMVVIGHIHQPQQLANNCYILGSPMSLDFSDVGDRGVYIYDTNTNELIFEKIDSPKFITINNKDDIKKDGNYYRLKGTKDRINDENVISVIEPNYFEERIKSDKFEDILKEWITINQKDESCLDLISDIILEKNQQVQTFFKGRLLSGLVENFLSIGKVEYELKNGLILLKGVNGSGKTSCLGEPLYYCLFGKTTKGLSGEDVIRNRPDIQKDALVEFRFTEDLTISRSAKNGLSIFKKGIDITKGFRKPDRQKVLEEQILGFSEYVFLASCYFSQEKLLMLTGLGDADKTNMITGLLGFNEYDDLMDKVSLKQKNLTTNLNNFSQEIFQLENSITINTSKKNNLDTIISGLSEDISCEQESILEINKDIVDLNDRLNNIKVEDIDIIDYSDLISECLERVDSNKFLLETKQIDIEQEDFDKQINDIRTKIANIEAEKRSIERDVFKQDTELKSIDTLKSGSICTKCGSTITEEHKSKYIEEIRVKLDSLIAELEQKSTIELKSELEDITKRYSLVQSEVRELQKSNSVLLEKVSKLSIDKSKSENKKNEYEIKRQLILKDIQSKEYQIEQTKKRIEQNTQKIDNNITEVTKIDTIINTATSEMSIKYVSMEKTNSDFLGLDFWYTAFSTKGIRSVLLDKFCNEFNKIVSEYIADSSLGTIQLLMTPTKSTKSGEERNKIGLEIVYNGYIAKYEGLSGGEKARVNVALCLALNKWVSNKHGIEYGLLGMILMDELFGMVDGIGEESIASLLLKESENKPIFIISHTEELGNWCTDVWNVKKEGEITTLG